VDQKHGAGPKHVLEANLGKQLAGVRRINSLFESSVGKRFVTRIAKLRPTFHDRCRLTCELVGVPLIVVIQKGKGESRAEYERLSAGLWEALQPEGALEELLVDKLATILWRQRRLLVAEGGEIRKNNKSLKLRHLGFSDAPQFCHDSRQRGPVARRREPAITCKGVVPQRAPRGYTQPPSTT